MKITGLTVDNPDHEIVIHGLERMVLQDVANGQGIVVAERTGGHTWTVKAEGMGDFHTGNRNDAVSAMIDMALAIGPKSGYITWENGYLINGELVHLRDLP